MPKKIVLIISTILGLLLVIIITWYRIQVVAPVSSQTQTVEFEIASGTPTKKIAQALKSKQLIKSPNVFLFYIKLNGISLQSGLYALSPSQNIAAIAEVIGKGKVSEHKITIPEGWRVEQIAQLFANKNIVSYEAFTKAAQAKEGRLFPDTYNVGVGEAADQIAARLGKNFERRIKEAGLTKVSDADLILASIVEREAKKDEDRAKMAGVYKNRLSIGMALEADPGTQYAIDSYTVEQLDSDKKLSYEFWKPITSEQNKTFESPYNTYRVRGLPPGPIANPGIKSIEAAIKPEKHNFFFFFNLSDGTTIYSKTRDEHDANRRKHGV